MVKIRNDGCIEKDFRFPCSIPNFLRNTGPMTLKDVLHLRMINQQIARSAFSKPAEVVNWMVAMQSQEFAMAKWAIGLSLNGVSKKEIEKDFDEGKILRTHLMRPTWHFVSPADIRWLLALTKPRVMGASGYMHRQLGLEKKIFKRSNDVLAKALAGGKQLTRTVLKSFLDRAGIKADGPKLGYLFMQAELDAVICSGARQGKQFTYALLDERAPSTRAMAREEALAGFVKRYFTSRGPATLQDFVYWSGLTMKDAREGAAFLSKDFEKVVIGDQPYIFLPPKNKIAGKLQTTFLLPDYDEYGMSYKNRKGLLNDEKILPEGPRGSIVFNHMIVVDGVIEGMWNRAVKKDVVSVQTTIARNLSKAKQLAVAKAVKKYLAFINDKA